MSDGPTRLEITPRIIDLGDRVIQLDNVASVAIATVHPLRGVAKLALAVFGVLALAELLRHQLGPASKDSPLFSAIAVLSLLALAGAIALFLYRKRLLVISTSDQQSAWVASGDDDFLRLVLEAVRTAMTGSDPAFRAHVDLVAMTISGMPAGSEPAPGPMLSAEPQHDDGWADAALKPSLPQSLNGAGHAAVDPPSLAHANGSSAEPARSPSFAEAMRREARASEPSVAPEARSNGRVELEEVIVLIDRAALPHKAELHALLEPVRDHLTGGRTRKNDALHNWKLFHDYAGKYLTDVSGLADTCRKVDTAFR